MTQATGQRQLLQRLLLEKYEPIAIVGIGLRFPGGNDTLAGFEAFLRDGRSGIGPIPADRWDAGFAATGADSAGTVRTSGGGFLAGLDQFDPKFFNISPKEADYIDPQQRLVLETAWEALENAAIDPATLRHGLGGVYLGAGSMDYLLELDSLPYADLDSHIGTGTAHSAVSGRVSYFLGWRGPCISVDTACSSSLVATHLAVEGLRRRECDIALAGGVNAIHHPTASIVFSAAGMLAPDGVCKTFDESADGYSRSEGCGVLVLKRLSDAQRAGDTVLALIRGSAVRQDGESAGLTVPNGTAQEAVMRAALAGAALGPGDIQYVEAHGTGTPLGDPIEMGAINDVFAGSRSAADPVAVGSVKTNLGHMEIAAGVGGIVKTVLQLRGGTIYPHLNLTAPSRRIPWDSYPVTVPTRCRPWPGGPRRALVNSFGFTGTIATIVLEQAPQGTPPAAAGPAPDAAAGPAPDAAAGPAPEGAAGAAPDGAGHVFTASARSTRSLRRQLRRYRDFLAERPDLPLADLCRTSNIGRSHFPVRIAGPVRSRAELAALLDSAADRPDRPDRDGAGGVIRRVAFLFTGQGAQYPGMGAALHRRYPVFRQHLDECDRLFAPHLGRSIREIAFGHSGDPGELDQTRYTQPALFAVEYATARLWQSWGVRPSVLIGHSIGEIAAAAVAGLFTLEDAVALVAVRARLMQSVSTPGGMSAVRAGAERVAPLLADYPDLGLAASNGPEQCVVSGGRGSLSALCARLAEDGIPTRALPVSHAFHSPLMAEVAETFRQAIAGIGYREPELTIVSNLTGRVGRPAELSSPDYWLRHILEPVDFAAGMRTVERRGRHAFVEVGPTAQLGVLGRACVSTPGDHLWLASGARSDSDGGTARAALAELYTAGLPVSWAGYHGDARRRVELPSYAFDRKRYWLPVGGGRHRRGGMAGPVHHPLLGAPVPAGGGVREFATRLSPDQPGYLRDHVAMGQVVVPAAAYLEALLAGCDAVFGDARRPVEDLRIHAPLLLSGEPVEVRTRLRPLPGGGAEAEIVSLVPAPADPDTDAGAVAAAPIERRHVTARIGGPDPAGAGSAEATGPTAATGSTGATGLAGAGPAGATGPAGSGLAGSGLVGAAGLAGQLRAGAEAALAAGAAGGSAAVMPAADLYAGFAEIGMAYGPAFQRVHQVVRHGDLAIGELSGQDTAPLEHLPPAVLDAALQTVLAVADTDETYLPVRFGSFQLFKKPMGAALRCVLRLAPVQPESGPVQPEDGPGQPDPAAAAGPAADLVLLEGEQVVCVLRGLRYQRVSSRRRLCHEPRWVGGAPAAGGDGPPRHLLAVGCTDPDRLAAAAAQAGVRLSVVPTAAGAAAALAGRPSDVCWFWRPDPGPVDLARLRAGCQRNYQDLLDLLAALEQAGFGRDQRLWLVTAGAHWLPGDPPADTDLAAATVWGFGQTLRTEYPAYRVSLLDLPPGVADHRPLLAEVLAAEPAEAQIAYRGGQRLLRRIVPADLDHATPEPATGRILPPANGMAAGGTAAPDRAAPGPAAATSGPATSGPAAPGSATSGPATSGPATSGPAASGPDPAVRIRPDRTYLITGGLGALGLATARALVALGARHLALVSRSGASCQQVAELAAALGAQTAVYAADVADPDDVERLVNALRQRPVPVGGIVHAAGALADAPVAGQTWQRIDTVFRAKVYGSLLLHRAAAAFGELDFFVGYSSIAAVLGPPAQANYAAGNAFLDGLMRWRAGQRLPGSSINWGPWAQAGMSASLRPELIAGITAQGIGFLRPATAVRALARLLAAPRPQAMVGEIDWDRLAGGLPAANALYEQVVRPEAVNRRAGRHLDLAALSGQPEPDRLAALTGAVREAIAGVLRFEPDEVEPDAEFVALGLDSLAAVALKNDLEAAFGVPLAASTTFDHPSVRLLARHLDRQLAAEPTRSG
jgi:acyl transferase domain-containing protein/acyl carrier protein